jgi:LPS-assembly protein
MKSARAAWLLSYLLFTSALAQAAPPVSDQKEVKIKADTLSVDVQSDSYRAQGSVHMIQDGASLLADSVIYSRLTGDALAQGNVFMERAGDTLRGDRLSLNLLSSQGQLSNGQLFIKKPNFYLRGNLLEKTGEEDYHVQRATFTTCDGDKPSWRFEARDVNVTLDDYATARDAVFYAGDIPLLYTPYLIFPAKRERQSGLLIPKFGRSSKKGFFIDQPYYWAISPSQDVTFDLDLESSRGAGVGADYRYMRARGSEGRFRGFGIYDTSVDRFRGEIDQKHLELISPNTTLSSDIHVITDRSYYRDYGEIAGDYNRQLLESSVSFDHSWERYGVTGEVRYAEDLLANNNDATLQRLPALSFIGAGQKIGPFPFFFSMDSGFTNFQRKAGVTGERLELHPRLSLYAKPVQALDFSVYGGYLERVYNAYGADAPGGVRDIGQSDAGATVSMPLERVYDGRVRHLLIPSFEYGFVDHKRDNDFPAPGEIFDYGDRVLGQSIATWSVASVFTGKFIQDGGAPEFRDLVYLKLSQGYQFSGERRDLLTLVDPGHHLTDLMLESRITPMKGISMALDGRYNPVDGNLSTGDVAMEVKGEGTNMASVGYRYSRNQVDYLEGRLVFPVAARFTGTVLGRYSFDKGGFLESRYALEYKQQCWSVIAAYADRPGSQLIPANREFTVNFALSGIGALGPIRAF